MAAEAARAGGQAVRDTSVYQGSEGPVRVDPQQARAAALSHVRAAGMSGQATVTAGATRIQVSATTSYRPVFLGLIGIGTQTVTGDGEAELTRVLDGTARMTHPSADTRIPRPSGGAPVVAPLDGTRPAVPHCPRQTSDQRERGRL